jgi:hypothetical protein
MVGVDRGVARSKLADDLLDDHAWGRTSGQPAEIALARERVWGSA